MNFREFSLQGEHGFKAVRHQAFVGTGYFDKIQEVVTAGCASTTAMKNSTEEAQFEVPDKVKLEQLSA